MKRTDEDVRTGGREDGQCVLREERTMWMED